MEGNQPQPNKEFYKQVSEVKFQSLLNWSELMNWIVIYGMVLQLMEWMYGTATKNRMYGNGCMKLQLWYGCMVLQLGFWMNENECKEL